jgi:hypothetical protein
MAIEYQGDFSDSRKQSLEQFAAELATHAAAGPVEGRLVVADPDLRGIFETMRGTLAKYMKDDEYESWRDFQNGRPVATGGKTFVADDDVITAVVVPIPQDPEFLGLASHELIEMAHKAQELQEGWIPPQTVEENNGIVMFDEYTNERIRQEIISKLGWSQSKLDQQPGLVSQADDIAQRMPPQRLNPAGQDFWNFWVHLAQVWAMVIGRRAAGCKYADAELNRWAAHDLIADQGWQPAETACDELYQQLPGLDRDQLVELAAEIVWRPIEQYGRTAWVPHGDSYP